MSLSANSRRAYAQAQRDFETSLGKPVAMATEADLARYRELLAGKGLAESTIKLRVGVVAKMMGVQPPPPSPFGHFPQIRKTGEFRGRTLAVEQVRRLLRVIPREKMVDFAIIVTILLSRLRLADFREWAWADFSVFGVTFIAVNGKNLVLNPSLVETLEMLGNGKIGDLVRTDKLVFAQRGKLPSLSAMKRHLQKYAKLAGMNEKDVTLETLRRTSTQLSKKMTDLVSDALAERAAPVVRWKVKKDVRLHGIGRRGK